MPASAGQGGKESRDLKGLDAAGARVGPLRQPQVQDGVQPDALGASKEQGGVEGKAKEALKEVEDSKSSSLKDLGKATLGRTVDRLPGPIGAAGSAGKRPEEKFEGAS